MSDNIMRIRRKRRMRTMDGEHNATDNNNKEEDTTIKRE
jgi:hypothetical protein